MLTFTIFLVLLILVLFTYIYILFNKLHTIRDNKKELEDIIFRTNLGISAGNKADKSNKTPEEIIRENEGRWN